MLNYCEMKFQYDFFQVSGATADAHVEHGDTVSFGNHKLEVRSTPGHTNGKEIIC